MKQRSCAWDEFACMFLFCFLTSFVVTLIDLPAYSVQHFLAAGSCITTDPFVIGVKFAFQSRESEMI